ncbi:hypothetical protein ACP2W0_04465 [Pseudobacillus badius]|uniref:hypothetical protein n=1 Tax=Bacillus badius TaxID=1455 RepID=UPI0007B07DA0|nr:hypothetical protein [Bacillus badius]KZN99494.1 hypothetical protein A4244_18280 [Bacillus badius]MED0667828.1 hypothetical protein [Bacillus badius]OCS85331.1 hypothetical protein A6M11_18295 [Bacillus badius]OVE50382.1 hypothetical protein B1A98_15840 [Bacillus badius]TDW01279.1 hypothetical protein B0G66_11264 [Bacillus badius]
MKEKLASVQAACQGRTHIWPLLPLEPVRVLLTGEEESWLLVISHQGMEFSKESTDHWHLKLTGRVEPLLEGQGQLRLYEAMGAVEVSGFYQVKLWFESLLWLCRPYYETSDSA